MEGIAHVDYMYGKDKISDVVELAWTLRIMEDIRCYIWDVYKTGGRGSGLIFAAMEDVVNDYMKGLNQ